MSLIADILFCLFQFKTILLKYLNISTNTLNFADNLANLEDVLEPHDKKIN